MRNEYPNNETSKEPLNPNIPQQSARARNPARMPRLSPTASLGATGRVD